METVLAKKLKHQAETVLQSVHIATSTPGLEEEEEEDEEAGAQTWSRSE